MQVISRHSNFRLKSESRDLAVAVEPSYDGLAPGYLAQLFVTCSIEKCEGLLAYFLKTVDAIHCNCSRIVTKGKIIYTVVVFVCT